MRCNLIFIFAVLFSLGTAQAEPREPLLIFAAASLKDVLDEIVDQYEINSGEDVKVALAASSTLARQIQAGAPADVYISADKQWIDFIVKNSLAHNESLKLIASNSLVVIGNYGNSPSIDLDNSDSFLNALGNERFAMGDPSHVPSGKYAKSCV